jgi:hypothetical protein
MPAQNGFPAFSVFVLRKTFAPFAVKKFFLTAKYAKGKKRKVRKGRLYKVLAPADFLALFAKKPLRLCGEKNLRYFIRILRVTVPEDVFTETI